MKRIIGAEGDQDPHRRRTGLPQRRPARRRASWPQEYRSHDDWGPQVDARGLLLRDGRSPQQQHRTAGTGASSRRSTSPARCRFAGGRWATRKCSRERQPGPPHPPPGGYARPDARPGPQPHGRLREAGPRLRDGGRQHRLRRFPVAHGLGQQRHRPRRDARGAQAARRGPPRTATASSRRSPPPASSCSCSSAVFEIGRSALKHFAAAASPEVTLPHLRRHDRDAGGQRRGRALRGGRGAALQQRAAPRRLRAHAHATSTRRLAS